MEEAQKKKDALERDQSLMQQELLELELKYGKIDIELPESRQLAVVPQSKREPADGEEAESESIEEPFKEAEPA